MKLLIWLHEEADAKLVHWLETPMTVSYGQVLCAGFVMLVLIGFAGWLALCWWDELAARRFYQEQSKLFNRLHEEAEEDLRRVEGLLDRLKRPLVPPPLQRPH